MPDVDFNEDEFADTYWEQEARNDRDEYDQHLQHAYEEARDELMEHGQ